jgi:hypothetical protein
MLHDYKTSEKVVRKLDTCNLNGIIVDCKRKQTFLSYLINTIQLVERILDEDGKAGLGIYCRIEDETTDFMQQARTHLNCSERNAYV